MTDTLRVVFEIGKKRRVVAGAMAWPGLDRWGTSEADALDKLSAYLPRYTGVAERAGLGSAFAQALEVEVVDLERRLDLLRACWACFDDTAARASQDLRPAARGGGRSRDQVIRHAYGTEPANWPRKVGVRTPLEVTLTPDGLATHRHAFLEAIRACNAERQPARTWPIQFLVRRTAQHVMDHACELEDRDLGAIG